ncbi:MAG: hypothetical protein KatS3mg103_0471 [Phycisphaerales bacterium]|nr:MAG: hypothetical protein KatS3mg103_0471 [Phycisphaerales bacterium]
MQGRKAMVLVCGLAVGLGVAMGARGAQGQGAWEAGAGRDGVQLLQSADGSTALAYRGQVFHEAQGRVEGLRWAAVPGSEALLVAWREVGPWGQRSYSAVSKLGVRIDRVSPSEQTIRLRYANFDPLAFEPAVPASLAAGPEHDAYIVQFIAQPIEAVDKALEAAGASVLRPLHDHARIVRMDAAALDAVRSMPMVRWVGGVPPGVQA